MFFAVLADCAFWYFCSSCMLKTVVRKEEHHLRHVLLCEMCISPLMVVFVEEKRYNFNECEFSIWWGAGWQLCPVLLVCVAAAFVDRVDGQGGLWCCQVIAVSFCSALNLGMTSGQPHRLELRVKILLAEGHSVCILGKSGSHRLGRLREELAEDTREWAESLRSIVVW